MWKVLPRDPNYMVSDDGQIKSVRKNKILTPKQNHDGYLRIQLWDHGSCVYVSIHRLIAEAFLPLPNEECTVINHKNGNKADNRIENLEWVTQRDNIIHAWKTGLSKPHKNRLGIPVRQLDRNGSLIREYPSQMEAERVTGIMHENINAAAKRNGTAGGYKWEVVIK